VQQIPHKTLNIPCWKSRVHPAVGEKMSKSKSNFLKVKCGDCGNQQIVFDHAASKVECIICGKSLVKSKGGRSEVVAQIIEVLD